MGDRITLARKLLDFYPPKALELLVDYLHNEEIREATERYIGQHQPERSPPPRLDTKFEQQSRSSRPTLQHPDSPPHHRTVLRQSFPDAGHGPISPPSTVSVRSDTSTQAEAAGRERIYLLPIDDESKEKPVWAKSASIKYNLISDSVIRSRGLGVDSDTIQERSVRVPHAPGRFMLAEVTKSANLTWRRRKLFKTTESEFFVIRSTLLDVDVILGWGGDGVYNSPTEDQEALSPHSRYEPGFVEVGEVDNFPAPLRGQTASMHPSIQRQHEKAEIVLESHQRMHTLGNQGPPMPNGLPTGSSSRPRQPDHAQTTHTAAPPAAQTSTTGQLLLGGVWEKTPIQVRFDPYASGETFYQAFHQWAVRRGRDLERRRTTLWLKTSREMSESEAYEICLDQDVLEEMWEAAVEWIQENKRKSPPHIFATVEIGPLG